MTIKKHQRDLRNLIQSEGADVIEAATTGGNHLRIRISDGTREQNVFVSATPSDRRARINTRAHVRRFLRGAR